VAYDNCSEQEPCSAAVIPEIFNSTGLATSGCVGVSWPGRGPALPHVGSGVKGPAKISRKRDRRFWGGRAEVLFCWLWCVGWRLGDLWSTFGLIFESLCGALKDLGYFFLRDSFPQMVDVVWAWGLLYRSA